MTVFYSDNIEEYISGKNIFLDNDFLGTLFSEKEATLLLEKLSEAHLIIDSLTSFEFLRDVFLPEIRQNRVDFLKSDFFAPTANHQETFLKIQDNAMVLSQLYLHKKLVGGSKQASFVDLFLAGRVMLNPSNSCIITGNRTDFPKPIFKLEGVITVEADGASGIKTFSVLSFDSDEFEQLYQDLERLQSGH